MRWCGLFHVSGPTTILRRTLIRLGRSSCLFRVSSHPHIGLHNHFRLPSNKSQSRAFCFLSTLRHMSRHFILRNVISHRNGHPWSHLGKCFLTDKVCPYRFFCCLRTLLCIWTHLDRLPTHTHWEHYFSIGLRTWILFSPHIRHNHQQHYF